MNHADAEAHAMETAPQQRPAGVTLVAWVHVVMASLSVLFAIEALTGVGFSEWPFVAQW